MKRALTLLLLGAAALPASAGDSWLDAVSPLMNVAERRAYTKLAPEARGRFQENFWAEKSIVADEYFRRLQHVDAVFGSTKTGSGANTDQGRVYLSIGAPKRVTRLPSSRIFAPLEIWYYDSVPELHLNTELRLIFYQKNALGLPRLYSPTLNTIRDLLLPQPSTRGMFGPNSEISESDIRTKLMVGPAEDEVIPAAISVGAGVTRTGNDELLAMVSAPALLLGKPARTEVKSRFSANRPKLDIVQSQSPYGGRQIDLVLNGEASRKVGIQVLDGSAGVYENQVNLKGNRALQYLHRLDLLPGSYTLICSLDGQAYPYALDVGWRTPLGEMMRVNYSSDAGGPSRPMLFEGGSFIPEVDGQFMLLTLPQAGTVTWTLRRNTRVILKSRIEGTVASVFPIPVNLESGTYSLEAELGQETRRSELQVAQPRRVRQPTIQLSFNANLKPSLRLSFLGHQSLLRNQLAAAREYLGRSLEFGDTREVQIELARAEALAGHWDAGRVRVRRVLAANPGDFGALIVLAYIETKLQDYGVAAQLYRRALNVQNSPTLRTALAQLTAGVPQR